MPGFDDLFNPLVPQSAIKPAQDLLDQRRLGQSPLEAQIRGFGAGALEGLRGLTSPVNLAGLLPSGRLLKFAPKVAQMAGPTLDVLEPNPVAQVMPAMDDVEALLGAMKGTLAKIPGKGQRIQAPNIPEFAPTTAPVAPATRGLRMAVDPVNEEQFRKYLAR